MACRCFAWWDIIGRLIAWAEGWDCTDCPAFKPREGE